MVSPVGSRRRSLGCAFGAWVRWRKNSANVILATAPTTSATMRPTNEIQALRTLSRFFFSLASDVAAGVDGTGLPESSTWCGRAPVIVTLSHHVDQPRLLYNSKTPPPRCEPACFERGLSCSDCH